MDKRICMHDVGVKNKNKVCFHHFTFEFSEHKDVCLIGKESVGKTSLLRAILGEVNYDGEILKEASCCGMVKMNYKIDSTIAEYLNYNYLNEKDKKLVNTFLKLKSFAYPISKLTKKFQIKVFLLSKILQNPNFFFLDDVLFDFSRTEKKELLNLFHQRKITLFYVTSNLEDTLDFPYLIVMGKNGILMEGTTLAVLKEEKILKRLGFSLPFLLDLSLQLQSYNLVDTIYLERKELVNRLWKSN